MASVIVGRFQVSRQPAFGNEFVEVERGRFEVVAATCSITKLKGMFGKAGKYVPIEEMNRTIAARGVSAR